jgi:hypothetical protein
MIRVGVNGFTEDEFTALKYLLYPYEVQLSREVDDSDLMICRQDSFASDWKPLITVRAPSTPRGYCCPNEHDNRTIELPPDLIKACSERFERVMNPRIAAICKLAARFPLQYNVVPSSIRSRIIRIHHFDSALSNHLWNEAARRILSEAFDGLGLNLKTKNPPSLLITHDVDTEKGLRRALALKAVDDDLGVQSVWFLSSSEYRIPMDIAGELAEGSTIGSHDTRHDGRLSSLHTHEALVKRLRESKLRLEHFFQTEIRCFRSPLLQFSGEIASALSEAGFVYDFSLPCWEPVHVPSMRGFGVESVREFEVGGVIEVPLTLFQDHQVLNVLRMRTREAVKFWVEQAKLVHSLGGHIVLLVHPDYDFSSDIAAYRTLLVSLLEVQASPAS